MNQVNKILGALTSVKKTASGWTARCPGHDDQRNSLSVSEGDDGKVLIHCHAGCTPEAVVSGCGLTLRDLMPDDTTQQTRRIIATYPYITEHGELVYEVVRYQPKDFRQRRPDGKGGYIWSIGNVQRILYRLPELLQADPGEPVFIVEGEKDVDNLHAIGLHATCNAGGANAWNKTDSSPLHNRHVVVIPDRDDAGEKHAEHVVKSLTGKAASIKILRLDCKDVSDWLALGGTAGRLTTMAQEQANQTTPAITLPTQPNEPTPALEPAKDNWQMPDEMLNMPGFVGELMSYTMQSAPYPNRVLAFAGALAMQAFLCGRKVRDSADNRTNLYVLGLANSGSGKDHPRKVNAKILHAIQMTRVLGERFASGEGLEDSLYVEPCMLYQTDEIDGMLQAINKSTDGRMELMMSKLLTLYSSSNTIYPLRKKAAAPGDKRDNKNAEPEVIDQPCLVIFGTAIPAHYYAALTEKMLTNGFLGRTLIMESRPRGKGQEPTIADPPEHIVEIARWWKDYEPSSGMLGKLNPTPAIVPYTPEAQQVINDFRDQVDGEYAKCEASGEQAAMATWNRVCEQTRKLALLYACSANHLNPTVTLEAVTWAKDFVWWQAQKSLWSIERFARLNDFDAHRKRVLQMIEATDQQTIDHSSLLKKMKMPSRQFKELIQTMLDSEEIECEKLDLGGRGPRSTMYSISGINNYSPN